MSISDLAQRINLPNIAEAEEYLLTMVFKTKEITINKLLNKFTILD